MTPSRKNGTKPHKTPKKTSRNNEKTLQKHKKIEKNIGKPYINP
jgi:hypothetical protein